MLEAHREKINSPGISVAVAIQDKIIWQAASGWRNIEQREPMSVDTILRIGSTSKALTSAGLARLVDQGTISLDDTLGEILTPLPNPNWSSIKIRNLASHTAGIPHYGDNTELMGLVKTVSLNTQYNNVTDAVKLFDKSDLLFEAGDKFEYSSLGTVLLSLALQKRADMPYQQWMKDQVFKPLGLINTIEENVKAPNPKQATFYIQESDTLRVKPWRPVNLSHRLAGGGWLSTSADLAMFGQGFLSYDFISESTRSDFWTPQALNNGEINHQQYAIGWRVHDVDLGEKIGQVKYAHHGGVSRGAQSFLMIIPEYGFSLAVNINTKTKTFSEFSAIVKPLTKLFIEASLANTLK
ncbi:serine hydrolase domain-containing protein [Thalassotalea euphylliae]